jgi:hypothetical protein
LITECGKKEGEGNARHNRETTHCAEDEQGFTIKVVFTTDQEEGGEGLSVGRDRKVGFKVYRDT